MTNGPTSTLRFKINNESSKKSNLTQELGVWIELRISPRGPL